MDYSAAKCYSSDQHTSGSPTPHCNQLSYLRTPSYTGALLSSPGAYPCVEASFTWVRVPPRRVFEIGIYISSCLLLIISWLGFWTPPGDRRIFLGLGIAVVLSILYMAVTQYQVRCSCGCQLLCGWLCVLSVLYRLHMSYVLYVLNMLHLLYMLHVICYMSYVILVIYVIYVMLNMLYMLYIAYRVKIYLTDHRSPTPLYRSLYFGPNWSFIVTYFLTICFPFHLAHFIF